MLIECPGIQHRVHVLPSACAVLTCVFDCMCHFSTEHEQHTCVPCVVFWDIRLTRMQVDSTCTAGRFNIYSRLIQHAQYQHKCTPCCFLGHSINTQMQVDSTCILLTHVYLCRWGEWIDMQMLVIST